MAASEIAGAVPVGHWNNASGASSATPLPLNDDAGNPSPAAIVWQADNIWNTQAPDTPGNSRMMRGYLDTGSGNPTVVTFTGLAAGLYDIYVYADGDNGVNAHSASYRLASDAGPAVTTGLTDPPNTTFNGTFTQAVDGNGNYVKFAAVVVTAGFTLTATPGASTPVFNPRAAVNGIQIVAVPAVPAVLTGVPGKTVTVVMPQSLQIPVGVAFSEPGTYNLAVSVTGPGGTATAQCAIAVSILPPPPVVPATPPVGDVVYPPGAGVFSVKNYGAKGDGVTDDTGAIRSAMNDAWSKQGNIIYFPSGTYLITDTLWWRDAGGTWRAWLAFQGQNPATTVIRLKDGSPGFGAVSGSPFYDGTNPVPSKAMLYMASNQETNPIGAGESAYINDVRGLTLDTGNNPGATPIDWCCSNTACLRDVILTGTAGWCGLNASRGYGGSGNGPALVKRLTVQGKFSHGIVTGAGEVSLTFEHVKISNVSLTAFWNQNQNVAIRDLQITAGSGVQPVVNEGVGNMTLIDSSMTGAGVPAAIKNSAFLFVRNLQTTGFGAAVSGVAGSQITEYCSAPPTTLFAGAQTTSMNLAIEETPEPYYDNDFTHWAVASDYGALPNGADMTAQIQAAFNSGKPVVFFPAGAYVAGGTLHVPASVKRILGVWSNFTAAGSLVIQFDGAVQDFRQFSFAGKVSAVNNTSGSLTVADVFNLNGFSNIAGKGLKGYLENTAINANLTLNGGTLFARQLDIELENAAHIQNNGGTLWVLGYKTEGASSLLNNANGAHTEILGVFNSTPGSGVYQGYFSTDSALSITGLSSGNWRSPVISETRAGVTKILNNTGNRYGGTAFALYSGR
jgi:hypothetical protein